jgi:uncharacterized membrane protein
MNATPRTTRAARTGARYLARHQVMGLAAQFLLGMALSLTGQPSQTSGAARIASTVLLALHVLVALGLAAGAAMVIRAAGRGTAQQRRLAWWGAAAIAVTIAAGVLTTLTKANGWSYAMAAGFVVSLGLYGGLLAGGKAPAQQAE